MNHLDNEVEREVPPGGMEKGVGEESPHFSFPGFTPSSFKMAALPICLCFVKICPNKHLVENPKTDNFLPFGCLDGPKICI